MTKETIQERVVLVNSAHLEPNSGVNPRRDTLRGTADEVELTAFECGFAPIVEIGDIECTQNSSPTCLFWRCL